MFCAIIFDQMWIFIHVWFDKFLFSHSLQRIKLLKWSRGLFLRKVALLIKRSLCPQLNPLTSILEPQTDLGGLKFALRQPINISLEGVHLHLVLSEQSLLWQIRNHQCCWREDDLDPIKKLKNHRSKLIVNIELKTATTLQSCFLLPLFFFFF